MIVWERIPLDSFKCEVMELCRDGKRVRLVSCSDKFDFLNLIKIWTSKQNWIKKFIVLRSIFGS